MPPSPVPVRHAVWRLVWLSTVFMLLYRSCNTFTHGRADVGRGVFDWETAIPFVPWTVWPYLSIVGFFMASFLVGRGRTELDRHCLRLVLLLAVALACYALVPLRFAFERPAVPGLTGLLFQGLAAFDLPYNRAPSLHIALLVLLWVRLAPQLPGRARLVLLGWFGLVGVSVLTTWQHHVIDIPAGLAAGVLCVVLVPPRAGRKMEARVPAGRRDTTVHELAAGPG